ncbi:MAG: hypothetical protein JXR70_09100 [Spirochaetales bacterium]|nr:hypothetical protein [Spirochaetales bacterium]
MEKFYFFKKLLVNIVPHLKQAVFSTPGKTPNTAALAEAAPGRFIRATDLLTVTPLR